MLDKDSKEFLDQEAELPDETTIVEADVKKSTSTEATTENKPEGQTPSPEENKEQDDDKLPFHKHPRWLAREQEFDRKLEKAVGETKAEYEARVEALEEKFSPLLKNGQPIKPSAFFAKVYGDDPELYKEYLAEEQAKEQRIRDETIEAYENKQRQVQEQSVAENKRWTDWVDTSIGTLKSSGKTFDENRLKSIALRDMPTDIEGNIDFNKAYNIMLLEDKVAAAEGKDKTDARKELAAQTTPNNKGETKAKDYLTHADIRKMR